MDRRARVCASVVAFVTLCFVVSACGGRTEVQDGSRARDTKRGEPRSDGGAHRTPVDAGGAPEASGPHRTPVDAGGAPEAGRPTVGGGLPPMRGAGNDAGNTSLMAVPTVDAGAPSECERDADCDTACVAQEEARPVDLAPLSLACGPLRDGRPPGRLCRTADDCDHGICVVAGSCVEPCASDADCGADRDCTRVFARTSERTLQPVDACVARADLPASASFERRTIPEAFSGSRTADAIVLPGETDGTSLFVLRPDRAVDSNVFRLSTRGASAATLFDLSEVDRSTSAAPRNGVSPAGGPGGLQTIHVPNGPNSRSAIAYEAAMFTSGPADVTVDAVTNRTRGRVLNVDLFYVGASDLAPRGPRGPERVAEALDRVEALFADTGIRLGEVRQHEVVGRLAERYGVLEVDTGEGQARLGRMLRLSAGVGRPSVSFFFIRTMDVMNGIALGLSGAIPGPPGIHGTSASGIVLSADVFGNEDLGEEVSLGRTMAHELGHFLGLFHTTERTGELLEPIPDTGACRETQDADDNGLLTPQECEDHGSGNLMFWTTSSGGGALTAQQADVIRRYPVLR